MNLASIVRNALDHYTLSPAGVHGPRHWARVLINGRELAEKTGADIEVVSLFAVLHDSHRLNDGHDPLHGSRASVYVAKRNGVEFDLSEDQLFDLVTACRYHTSATFAAAVTVQACWDADRLDLSRVGVLPDPRYLNTEAAKDMIEQASLRACERSQEEAEILEQWGIKL